MKFVSTLAFITALAAAGAGTGYTPGDILTAQGGTFNTPVQVRFTQVGAAPGAVVVAMVKCRSTVRSTMSISTLANTAPTQRRVPPP